MTARREGVVPPGRTRLGSGSRGRQPRQRRRAATALRAGRSHGTVGPARGPRPDEVVAGIAQTGTRTSEQSAARPVSGSPAHAASGPVRWTPVTPAGRARARVGPRARLGPTPSRCWWWPRRRSTPPRAARPPGARPAAGDRPRPRRRGGAGTGRSGRRGGTGQPVPGSPAWASGRRVRDRVEGLVGDELVVEAHGPGPVPRGAGFVVTSGHRRLPGRPSSGPPGVACRSRAAIMSCWTPPTLMPRASAMTL